MKRFIICSLHQTPITVAALSKAWTVFARSNAGIVGSNPTQGMDVCVWVYCVYVVLCVGSGFPNGWSSVQGVLPTVYRIKKLKEMPRPNNGLQSRNIIEQKKPFLHKTNKLITF
jgi:hypothetical protein